MTGWPTATASSMFSSSALTMLSSATDGELALRVLASRATTALARCIGVEGRPALTPAGSDAGGAEVRGLSSCEGPADGWADGPGSAGGAAGGRAEGAAAGRAGGAAGGWAEGVAVGWAEGAAY